MGESHAFGTEPSARHRYQERQQAPATRARPAMAGATKARARVHQRMRMRNSRPHQATPKPSPAYRSDTVAGGARRSGAGQEASSRPGGRAAHARVLESVRAGGRVDVGV